MVRLTILKNLISRDYNKSAKRTNVGNDFELDNNDGFPSRDRKTKMSRSDSSLSLKKCVLNDHHLLIETTMSSFETVWVDCTFDNKTAVSLEKVYTSCNNLIIDPTSHLLETTWMYCIFDYKKSVSLEKVDSLYKNELIYPTVSSLETS